MKKQLYFTNICKDVNTAAVLFFLSTLAEMFKGVLLLSFILEGKKTPTKTNPTPSLFLV